MNLSKKVDSIKIVLPPQDPFHFHESFPRKIEIVHILWNISYNFQTFRRLRPLDILWDDCWQRRIGWCCVTSVENHQELIINHTHSFTPQRERDREKCLKFANFSFVLCLCKSLRQAAAAERRRDERKKFKTLSVLIICNRITWRTMSILLPKDRSRDAVHGEIHEIRKWFEEGMICPQDQMNPTSFPVLE